MNEVHLKKFRDMADDNMKQFFPEQLVDQSQVFCHFAKGLTEKQYSSVPTMEALKKVRLRDSCSGSCLARLFLSCIVLHCLG